MCREGAISPAVPKDLRAVNQDTIGCTEFIMRVTIVVTTESTQGTIVDARCSDTYKVRPDCLHSYTKGGANNDTVNAAVVDLDSIGC